MHKDSEGLLHPTHAPINSLHATDPTDLETGALGHVSSMTSSINALKGQHSDLHDSNENILDSQLSGHHTSINVLTDGQPTGHQATTDSLLDNQDAGHHATDSLLASQHTAHTAANPLTEGQQTGHLSPANSFLDGLQSGQHAHTGLQNAAPLSHDAYDEDLPHEASATSSAHLQQDLSASRPTIHPPTGVTLPTNHVTTADQSHVTLNSFHFSNLHPTVTPDAVNNRPLDSQFEPCMTHGNHHLQHQQHLNQPCSAFDEHALTNPNPNDPLISHAQHDPTRPNPVHPVNPLLDPDNPLHQTAPADILDIDPIRVQELNSRRPENGKFVCR